MRAWNTYKVSFINLIRLYFPIIFLIGFILFPFFECRAQNNYPHPQLINPGGFSEVTSNRGVTLYYNNNTSSPVYIQLIDLRLGAHLVFLHGPQINSNPAGCFGATDPKFDKLSIDDFWGNFTSQNSRAFSIINGGYFDCGFPFCEPINNSGAFLSFPFKTNINVVSGGHDCGLGKVLRSLEIDYNNSSAIVSEFFRPGNPIPNIGSTLYSDEEVFVGISPFINLNDGDEQDSRNYIGLVNNHTIAILLADFIKPSQAIQILNTNCGIPSANIIESDGGGSQKFIGQTIQSGLSTTYLSGHCDFPDLLCHQRRFPQAIGVAFGSNIQLKLNSPINITPGNVNQCATVSITANIKNEGPNNWNGKIITSINKMNGEFIQNLNVASNIFIPYGETSTISVSFPLNSIQQVQTGNTYKIYFKYQTNGTPYPNEYPIVGSGNYLNPTFLPVNYSSNCNDVTIPPGSFKSVYLSGLNLNSQTNELEFLLQGIPAQNGDVPVNVANEAASIKKEFKQALAIPEPNQWISLEINQSNIGNAITGINFQNTDLAKKMFVADARLKFSSVFKPITGFSAYTGTFTDWNTLLSQGPYFSQLQSLSQLYYPSWGVFAGIHSKNLNYSSQGATKIIINNAEMEMHKGILWTELDNGVNSLAPNLRNTLLSKITPYRAQLLQRLQTGVNNTTPLVNINGPEFQALRNMYRVTAAANWYKRLTNLTNKPYQSLINSNNLSGIMVSPPYDDNYWNGQALQPLPHLVEAFHYYNNQGNDSYSCVGGISLGNYQLVNDGPFNNVQSLIDSVCFKNNGSITDGSSVYFYGGTLNRKIAELSPFLQHKNKPVVLDDIDSIHTIIYNFSDEKAQNFQVRLYERYTNSQNQIQNILIGQQTIALLDSFSSQPLLFTWTPNTHGNKKIFITVDEGNVVTERLENNNTALDSLVVFNNVPTVQIFSPATGSSTGNQDIILNGSGFDYRDGILQNGSLSWSSNRDGFLGNGSVLQLDSISTGTHIIKITGTNLHGQTAFTTINLYVYQQGFPVISIGSPVNNITYPSNAPVMLSGNAFDITQGDLCNVAMWSSNLIGTLGSGCNLNTTLPIGTHTITLSAQNASGNASSAIRNITIVSGVPHLTVASPIAQNSFFQHQNILFSGTANDFPQGNISSAIKWYSNLQGLLGTGQQLSRPLNPGTHIITAVIQDNSGGIDTVIISPITIRFSPPIPVIVSPVTNSSFNYQDTVQFIGHATDLQDGPLHGNSLKWYSNFQGFLGFSDTLNISALNFGLHTIALKATDSNNADSVVAVFNIFIDAGQPQCSIIQPAIGSTFNSGTPITFKGVAIDPQNGPLSGNQLQWYSSLDGNLGTGDSISTSNLNPGNHSIILSAIDADGFTGTTTRSIIVLPPQAPVISIYYPVHNSHFLHGALVMLKANATDFEEGVLNNNRVTWSSSINGHLGTGKLISANTLSPGNHIISATCIDTTGLITTATVQVIIDQQKPVATINAPVAGSVFAQGTNITLAGSATDYEDGILTGNSLQWSSDTNTSLGSGNNINTATLVAGSHLVMLIATDSQNAKDTTDILLIIQAPRTVLLTTFSSGVDSISHFFPNRGDTIIYVSIPKGATVMNAQARMTGRSDLVASVSITANPSGIFSCGSPVTFTASVINGGSSPSFQWQINGTNLGTNSSTFNSNSLQNGDRVRVIMISNLNNVSETNVISNTIIVNCN